MDDAALRDLATRLRAELDSVVTDPADRVRVLAKIDAALGADPPDRDTLLDAFNASESTRSWFAGHAPVTEDVERSFELLPGMGVPAVLYYVCPEGDEDLVLDTRPARPPRCPKHGIEMITED